MATSTSAPATYKQPSRKGKKAWRKNIDVTDVQEGLDEVREQIIDGGIVAEKPSDQLFAIDTTGSDHIRKTVLPKHSKKPLKVDEILAQRSAIPAVSNLKRLSDFETEKKPKKQRITHKEYDKLRAIAYGGDKITKDVVETGGNADHDPWAVQEAVKEKDPRFSFLEEKKATREPSTLKRAPVSLAKGGKQVPAVRKPVAGKSYNPLLEDWAELLEKEGNKEVEAEKQRLEEARREAEIMERAMRAEEEEEAEAAAESTWESEWEGFSDAEGSELKKKRPERKTPAQRNKIKRRKEAEAKAKHEARMKEREKQAAKIKDLIKSVEEKEKARAATLAIKKDDTNAPEVEDGEEEVLRKRRFGKYPVPEAPLEVVLADELQDSLRRLKPEGNLLNDRMRSMLIRGKVESRKQVQKKSKKTTVSEKWSYKDWTLDKAV